VVGSTIIGGAIEASSRTGKAVGEAVAIATAATATVTASPPGRATAVATAAAAAAVAADRARVLWCHVAKVGVGLSMDGFLFLFSMGYIGPMYLFNKVVGVYSRVYSIFLYPVF
jgi:hypothetical protein